MRVLVGRMCVFFVGDLLVRRVNFGSYGDTELKRVIDRQSIIWNNERLLARGDRERTLYASDYGQCMRKVWFEFFPEQFPVSFDSRVLRIFHNGEVVHERLAGYLLKDKDIFFKAEVDVPRDDLDVHGRCDGICVVDGQAVVVEFKTINRSLVRNPKPEHVGQILWYMAMWRKLRQELKDEFGVSGREVSESDLVGVVSKNGRTSSDLSEEERWVLYTRGEILGEIIYESKQNQQTYHFVVRWSEQEYRKVRSWFERLKYFVDRREMPVVSYDSEKFPCSWGRGVVKGRCPFFRVCYPESGGETTKNN